MTQTTVPKRVILRPGRERPILQRHPWVLSGSVARVEGDPQAGDDVQLIGAQGEPLGYGDYDPASQLRVRVHHFGAAEPPPEADWLRSRLVAALSWRQGHPKLQDTDALRGVNSEADALPGLTVDRYADWWVVKCTSPAMGRRVEQVAGLLVERGPCQGIWLRGELDVDRGSQSRELYGSVPEEPITIQERGRKYAVDLRHGQKTGFYLDQRDARDLFRDLAPGSRVLDLFAYTGGFSVAAQQGGADEVVAVESGKRACELLRGNTPGAEVVQADVARFLREDTREFDRIVLDPPPFARRKRDVQAACRAYKDLHLQVLRRAAPGAELLSFSCSHHVPAELFRKVVASAARECGADLRIWASLEASPDHPVDAAHPQGEYLKGLAIHVVRPGR